MVMRQRQLDRVDYTASKTVTVDIPREHFLKKLLLKFVGQCDSGSAVSKSTYNPFDIVSKVEIVANGNVVKSISGKMLYLNNIFEHGCVPDRTQTPASTSQSNQAFGGSLTVYFDKDKDYAETLLPSMPEVLKSLQLKITWGTATDIDSGSGFNIDNLYCYPLLTEEVNRGQAIDGLGVLKEVEYVKTLTQSGWCELDIPVGNVYQRFAILARDNTAVSNTIISEYEVKKDGLEVIRSARFDQSRAEDLQDYALEAANQPTGYTLIDLDMGGSSPINTKGWSSLKLRFNVSTTPTATSDVTVVAEELVPPQ